MQAPLWNRSALAKSCRLNTWQWRPLLRSAPVYQAVRVQNANQPDVVSLGNLCLDIVVPVNSLPPKDLNARAQLLEDLTAHPPDKRSWELGGNCNFMLAAARIGLNVACVGHLGSDIYGKFMEEALMEENVAEVQRIAPLGLSELDKTLLCFVLVDCLGGHAFCSRYDFGPWPLLQGIDSLPDTALQAVSGARAVFTNGFVFDELPLEVVKSTAALAIASGAAVFFDPGPRCATMMTGSRRDALDTLMDLSTVVLMTEEEAHTVSGLQDAEAAARWVLDRPGAITQWAVVKMGGSGSLVVNRADGRCTRMPGLRVDVVDTVGCGDSFAAAVVLGYINNVDVGTTLMLANAVGAATATGRGAGRNVARASVVEELLITNLDSNPMAGSALQLLQATRDSCRATQA